MTNTVPRYSLIDILRTLAIVLMVIYHFTFDLSSFGYIEVQTFLSLPSTVIGRSSLQLFLFCVGYSLMISHRNGIQWQKFTKRLAKVSFFALLVSFATYFSHPKTWVYFGILHHIAVASLVGLLLLRIPGILTFSAGLAMMIAYWGWNWYLPWIHLSRPSLDYIALFPWFGCVMMGIGAYSFKLHDKVQWHTPAWVHWMSRNSLWIYLIHQPILMGSLWLFSRFVPA